MLTACKTKQQVATTPTLLKDATFFYTQIVENAPSFSTANISKMSIDLTINQQSWSLYGSLRMKTDTVIILSLQPLFGYEMLRIELYPEQIRIFDKLNRKYVESNYDYFSSFTSIPITFSMLQDIFTQQLFVIGREIKELSFNDIFLVEKTSESYNLTSTSGDGRILHRIEIAPDYKIRNIDLSIFLEGSSAQTTYGETDTFKKTAYPTSITLAFHSKNNQAKLSFNIMKAVFDKPTDTTPIDASRYQRTTFNQLLTK